jgi:cytochrome c553
MSKKIAVTAAICFAMGIGMAWIVQSGSMAVAQTSHPKMKFEEESFDFGKINEGAIVEHVFKFTNIDEDTLKIAEVKASCGCTAALLSANNIPPNGSGEIKATFNSRGKSGSIRKTISVRIDDAKRTVQVISFTAFVEAKAGMEKTSSHPGEMSGSYFEGKCVNCHVEPGVGKLGRDLFAASCAMCHGNEGKGSVAAPLHNSEYLKKVGNDYLEKNIAEGSTKNKMMLGFATEHQGPLTKVQITSLVEYIRTWEHDNVAAKIK